LGRWHIEHGGINVQGAGKSNTTIVCDGDLFKQSTGGGPGGFFDLSLKNDSVRGKLFKYVGSVDTGFPLFQRVIFNTSTYHIYATAGAIVGLVITDCQFTDASICSRYFESLWVYDESSCYTSFCTLGLWVNGTSTTCSIRGSVFEQNNYEGIKLTNTTTSEIHAFSVDDTHFEVNGKLGSGDVYIATTGAGRIRTIEFDGCGFFSPSVGQPKRVVLLAGGTGNIANVRFSSCSNVGAIPLVTDSSSASFDNTYDALATVYGNVSTTVQVPSNFNGYLGSVFLQGVQGGSSTVQCVVTPLTGTRVAIARTYGSSYNGTADGNDSYLEAVYVLSGNRVRTLFDFNSTLGGGNQGFVATWTGTQIQISNKSGMGANQSGDTEFTFYG